MKLSAKCVVWLLPLLLTGCFHKTNTQIQPLAPPIEDTPPPKPVPSPTNLPPTVVTVPNQTPAPEPSVSAQPKEPPKPPARRRKAASNTQLASNGNPGVSAIGQLSYGAGADLRQQTANSIMATERGLSGIGRRLNDQEQKTAAQIRKFLRQAKVALDSGDVDGAHTLAAKAKVLLGELNR
jgi:hypothetical protein